MSGRRPGYLFLLFRFVNASCGKESRITSGFFFVCRRRLDLIYFVSSCWFSFFTFECSEVGLGLLLFRCAEVGLEFSFLCVQRLH